MDKWGLGLGMDDRDFRILQYRATEGDPDAMVDLAFEFRLRRDNQQAFAWLLRAGDAGNMRAMAALALAYRDGAGVEKNVSQSLLWLERGAQSGDPGCMVLMAEAFREGTSGVARDPTQMLAWLLKAIRAGSAEAMRLLGQAYATGMGVIGSAATSFVWYERAARAGDVRAMLKTAEAFLSGLGVEPDPGSYFNWTKQAAERGERVAMFNLANAYDTGLGTGEDKAAFVYWMTKAAEHELPSALFVLATAYRDGSGVNPDQNEYFRLLGRAAAAGDPRALNALAINHLYGFGVPIDKNKYVQLLTAAAETGDANAMFNLAHAYRDGEGVAKDPSAWLAWLAKASKLRQLSAMVELAAYAYRIRLPGQRQAEAAQLPEDLRFELLAQQAAELGDARAMYLLAMAHRVGVGMPRNPELARQWLERAAQAGLPTAMTELAIAYRRGTGYEQSNQAFFGWIRKAAEAGEAPAMTTLALAYHDGRGTERNLTECRSWMERAHEHGEPRAFMLLGLLEIEELGESLPEDLQSALKSFMALQSEVLAIKKTHIVREASQGAAYFTTFEGLTEMLGEENGDGRHNRLRMLNAAYLDDPAEGSRLLDTATLHEAKLLRDFFAVLSPTGHIPTLRWNGHEYGVYIASFSLRNDQFDLWRTQGHNGAGYAVVTPLSAFRQQGEVSPVSLVYEAELASHSALPEPRRFAPPRYVHPAESQRQQSLVRPVLYRVEYDKLIAAQVLERLEAPLTAITAFKHKLKRGAAIVDALVRILVSDVLYLYKSEIYEAEQEARVVMAFDLASEYVKIEPCGAHARLYAETEPFLFSQTGSRIIIGPNVADRAAAYLGLRYRLARHQWSASTEVEYSVIEYR